MLLGLVSYEYIYKEFLRNEISRKSQVGSTGEKRSHTVNWTELLALFAHLFIQSSEKALPECVVIKKVTIKSNQFQLAIVYISNSSCWDVSLFAVKWGYRYIQGCEETKASPDEEHGV